MTPGGDELTVDPAAGAGEEAVQAALDALDLARRRFVNVAGHELRTPVTTLRGLAEELATADPETVRADLAPALVRTARRVERLLDDLLVASDIVTALPVGDPEPVDLVATAQAIWDALTDADGDRAEPGGDGGDDLRLEGDAEAVAALRPGAADQLLERVLDNARRYGGPPTVLRAEVRPDVVRLTVSSTGADVAADDLHLAFELFYRGEGAVTAAPGFGLGLPVARALARQHGGDVTLDPRPGGGLDVAIELPRA